METRFGYNVWLADHKKRETYWHHPESGAKLLTHHDAWAAANWLVGKYDLKDADIRIVDQTAHVAVDENHIRQQQGRTKVGSKMDRAVELFYKHPDHSRKQMIQLFVEEIGMTPAGASTYYQSIKSNSKSK